ncbi:MAG: HPF/RaiA family ribosome-associated protein [Kofleriaceae bacterium]
MQIQVRHDDNISGSDRLSERVAASVEAALGRFGAQITRVEVFLADENGPKAGGDDIRCTMEARLEGRQPTAVTHHASDLEVAVDVAADKLARALDHQLGRIRENVPIS